MGNITSIREAGLEESATDEGKRQYELAYFVTVDDPNIRTWDILGFQGVVDGLFIPVIGVPASFDPLVVCTRRECRIADGSRNVFLVRTKFEQDPPKDPEKESENPLSRPPKKSWRTVKVNRLATKDTKGKPILNKAGLPYETAVERRSSHIVLTIARVEATFDGKRAFEFVDRTNEEAFSYAEPGTVICDIAADNFYEEGREYWDVTYEFEYDPLGWDPELLEQGYMELKSDQHVRIKDRNGEDVSEPVPLGENGQALDPSTLPDSAVYTKWSIYERTGYGKLKLPV